MGTLRHPGQAEPASTGRQPHSPPFAGITRGGFEFSYPLPVEPPPWRRRPERTIAIPAPAIIPPHITTIITTMTTIKAEPMSIISPFLYPLGTQVMPTL